MGPWDARVGVVRILRRPSGEAPEWVRDAWIGLDLPLVVAEPVTDRIVGGILTAPRSPFRQWFLALIGRSREVEGWIVDADASVRLLEVRNPAAAEWWRTHAGRWVQPGRLLIFDLQSGEPAEGLVTPAATD